MSEPQTLNKPAALERMGDDLEIYEEVVMVFVEDTPIQIEYLRNAIDALDREEIRRLAHSLKSAAGNVGGERMQAVAYELEKAALNAETAEIATLSSDLENCFNSLRTALGDTSQ